MKHAAFLTFALLCLVHLTRTVVDGKTLEDPIVMVTQGAIRGSWRETVAGRKYRAFLGVPFAKPPVGCLRFKPPKPVEQWKGVLDVIEDPPRCLQVIFGETRTIGKEDCLYLNVFSPNSIETEVPGVLMPVHVFIHGGTFFGGHIDSSKYGPDLFMDKGIILLLMNYRLGPLGFLSTNDKAACGNYGLLDQNFALKWVRDNIKVLGGDPNQVTLGGQGSGGASVIFHYLSPMSKGLFQRAIAQSGSALCTWALNEQPLSAAQALGTLFKCSENDTFKLVDCLRQQDGPQLVGRHWLPQKGVWKFPFLPSIEDPSCGNFLTDSPMALLEKGIFNKVPIILGFNRDDGVFVYKFISKQMETIDESFFEETIPILLQTLTNYDTNLRNVSEAIEEEYYATINVHSPYQVGYTNVNLISDLYMKSCVTKTVDMIASNGIPTYFYQFRYVSESTTSSYVGRQDVILGAELKFLFTHDTDKITKTDRSFGKQFSNLWINFITKGQPTQPGSLEWLPNPASPTRYMKIDTQNYMVHGYDSVKMRFWNVVVPRIVNNTIERIAPVLYRCLGKFC